MRVYNCISWTKEKIGAALCHQIPFPQKATPKIIHRQLYSVLSAPAYSRSQVRNWWTRFTEGDVTYIDQWKADRARHVLGTDLSQFLQEFPFATAEFLAQHFDESKETIQEKLNRELVLQKFSRR
jgi:hypothetical protein